MVPLQYVLQNPEIYISECEKRFRDSSGVAKIIELEEIYRPKLAEVEALRRKKNLFNSTIFDLEGDEKRIAIGEMKEISDAIKSLDLEIKDIKNMQTNLLYAIPNITWEHIPVGRDDSGNVQIKQYNSIPRFSFEPKHYYELELFKRDYNAKQGVDAAGFRGYYITGSLARLQRVLFEWVMERLEKRGFQYVIPPIMVLDSVLYGTGFFPEGMDDVYVVSKGDKTLYLPGTSEAALMYLYQGQTLDLTTSPVLLTAQTRCFRAESGSYGKDTKGGFRVHEFEKIETVALCRPQDGYALFETLTHIFHEMLDELGIHYIDSEVCTGDISIKNNRQIDIEGYFPAQQKYRELCSSSYCTDYQTNTLGIKTFQEGAEVLAHSLNCTGITNRTLLCLLEQFQQEDGTVIVPQVLADKFGKTILS